MMTTTPMYLNYFGVNLMKFCSGIPIPFNWKISGKRLVTFGAALILAFLAVEVTLLGQTPRKVYRFDIDGLKLNMNLDDVIEKYKINNINVNKDAQGFINGYEIKKRLKQKKTVLVLSFTGEKRLYRIQFSKLFEKFKYHPRDLFVVLKRKYGPPWNDNSEDADQKGKNIFACWGSSCKKYPRTTPILTASIHYSNGGLKLMLSDNRIFNRDWKKYKQKLSDQKTTK